MCKWIKASERLPKMEKVIYLKDSNGIMNIGNFYEDDCSYMLYFQRNGAHESYEIPFHHFTDIFWLDESPQAEGMAGEETQDVMWNEIDEIKEDQSPYLALIHIKQCFNLTRKK